MNEITIGDKIYISAKRAAEITGYARDYVGQLCREGHVDAKMVGRSWYVYEPSIRAHRFGQEAVLEQESAEPLVVETPEPVAQAAQDPVATASDWQTPTYSAEAPDLLPELTPASLEELLPPAEETLTDMQAAWREWFDQKKKVLETPEIESPEILDARNEAHEAEIEAAEAAEESVQDDDTYTVPLQRIHEEEIETSEEEIVPIHHIAEAPAPVYMPAPAAHMDIGREVPAMTRYSEEESFPAYEQGRVVEERVIVKGSRSRNRKRAARSSNAPIIALLVGVSLISITIALIGTGYAGRYLRTLPAVNNPVINFLVGTQKISK